VQRAAAIDAALDQGQVVLLSDDLPAGRDWPAKNSGQAEEVFCRIR
jgi:hypothetical protein